MLILAFATIAIAATAQQSDPVIASIQDAYKQAKVMMKQNKGMGNELVTKANLSLSKSRLTPVLALMATPLLLNSVAIIVINEIIVNQLSSVV